MGVIGDYIDRLPREAQERVAKAKRWRMGGYVDVTGARCLIGHAADMQGDGRLDGDYELLIAEPRDMRVGMGPFHVYRRFDALCDRFGIDRVVRACRARAAQAVDRQQHGGGGMAWSEVVVIIATLAFFFGIAWLASQD